MKSRRILTMAIFFIAVGAVSAQPQPRREQGPPPPGQPGPFRPEYGPPPPPVNRIPRQDMGPQPGRPQMMPPGKWWEDPGMSRHLSITPEQQKKMSDIFQQSRLKLIDLHAALEKDEAILEPLMQTQQLDDAKILPQIDRIAQDRAELEKANARLLLGIRHVLTDDQWKMLESDRQSRRVPQGPPPSPNRRDP